MQIAAQGATVDINDSVMTSNLQALGTIRANQSARQNGHYKSGGRNPNPRPVAANHHGPNCSASTKPCSCSCATLQDANQINANLALQQIVAQKQQQDAMKAAFRDSSAIRKTTTTPT